MGTSYKGDISVDDISLTPGCVFNNARLPGKLCYLERSMRPEFNQSDSLFGLIKNSMWSCTSR